MHYRDTRDVPRARPFLTLLVLAIFAFLLSGCSANVTPPADTDATYNVYYNRSAGTGEIDCAAVYPVPREIEPTDDPGVLATDLLDTLFAGPTEEEKTQGYSSFFSEDTGDILNEVAVEGGIAMVDLEDIREEMPNVSSSCGSAAFVASIEQTLKQLPDIQNVVITIDGDQATFDAFIQR